jgi:hypothetical protein
LAERLLDQTASEDDEDDDYLSALRLAGDIDELLRNNITVSLESFSPGEVAALRGIWRGRAAHEKKQTEEAARKREQR